MELKKQDKNCLAFVRQKRCQNKVDDLMVILTFGHFEKLVALKLVETNILIRMCFGPVLEGIQISHAAKQPLVVGIKHPFLQQLPLVLK